MQAQRQNVFTIQNTALPNDQGFWKQSALTSLQLPWPWVDLIHQIDIIPEHSSKQEQKRTDKYLVFKVDLRLSINASRKTEIHLEMFEGAERRNFSYFDLRTCYVT